MESGGCLHVAWPTLPVGCGMWSMRTAHDDRDTWTQDERMGAGVKSPWPRSCGDLGAGTGGWGGWRERPPPRFTGERTPVVLSSQFSHPGQAFGPGLEAVHA